MTKRTKRRLIFGTLVLGTLIAAAAYGTAAVRMAARSDQRGLVLASFLREVVPGFRVPAYFPYHGPAGKSRDLSETALISIGVGSLGGCSYWSLRPCQAFAVDSEVLLRGDRLSELLRFLDRPCAQVKAAVPGVDEERRRTANAYFGCEGNATTPHARIVVNVVEKLDDPARVRSSAGDDEASAIRYRIVKKY